MASAPPLPTVKTPPSKRIASAQMSSIKYDQREVQHTYFYQSVIMLQPEICGHPHNICSMCLLSGSKQLGEEFSATLLHLSGTIYLLTFAGVSHSTVF
jgi:hypothetical protein